MNHKMLILGALGVSAGLVIAGCSGSNGGGAAPGAGVTPPAPPSGQTTQEASTAEVLGLAQETSEVDAPFAVNGGAFTITDTSDTSSPLPIDMM